MITGPFFDKNYGKSEPRIAMLVPDNALKEPKMVTPRLVGDRAEIELQSRQFGIQLRQRRNYRPKN